MLILEFLLRTNQNQYPSIPQGNTPMPKVYVAV